jgi:hypothetical protein
LFQVPGALPSRVIVKPWITTPPAVTWTVEVLAAPLAIGPRIVVVAWPAPCSVSCFATSTSSSYVPAATSMVSPGSAASTADWIVEYVQVPGGLHTSRVVAADAGVARTPSAMAATSATRRDRESVMSSPPDGRESRH